MTRPGRTIRSNADHAPLASEQLGPVQWPPTAAVSAVVARRIHECARDEADEALLTDMVLGGAA
jgi:hypothetical protein